MGGWVSGWLYGCACACIYVCVCRVYAVCVLSSPLSCLCGPTPFRRPSLLGAWVGVCRGCLCRCLRACVRSWERVCVRACVHALVGGECFFCDLCVCKYYHDRRVSLCETHLRVCEGDINVIQFIVSYLCMSQVISLHFFLSLPLFRSRTHSLLLSRWLSHFFYFSLKGSGGAHHLLRAIKMYKYTNKTKFGCTYTCIYVCLCMFTMYSISWQRGGTQTKLNIIMLHRTHLNESYHLNPESVTLNPKT